MCLMLSTLNLSSWCRCVSAVFLFSVTQAETHKINVDTNRNGELPCQIALGDPYYATIFTP